jgi:two-component system sensor kinase FixL
MQDLSTFGRWAQDSWPMLVLVALVLLQAALIGALLLRRSRGRLQHSLDSSLRFERTLEHISRTLAGDDTNLEKSMRDALEHVAHQFGVERAFVHELGDGNRCLQPAFEWLAPGTTPPPREISADDFPVSFRLLEEGRMLRLDGETAHEEWKPLQTGGVRAFMVCPLRVTGSTVGTLTVSSRAWRPRWSTKHERRLQAFANVFANVLAHRRLRLTLHNSESFTRVVLAAYAGEVAIVDNAGVVVRANDAWQRAATSQFGPLVGASPGLSYEGTTHARVGSATASEAIASLLRSVLAGMHVEASADVEWERPDGRRWSQVRVQKLGRPEGGAVLSLVDVTARKRAEVQVQRHLHELAHLNMVAAVGELAASVAHELNQPLTAVLSNAQALRRMMTSRTGDPQMMIEIVEDIIAQDKRAGEVIQRIRRLLKKETVDWAPVDVNVVVQDIARMFSGQGTLAGVPITLELTPGLPLVQGDRVQLQQVFLNLVQNAVHAVRGARSKKLASICLSTRMDGNGLQVVVRDEGPGIPADLVDRIFEPFVTTKREGLGLGLSISRSIIDLHGGVIAAHNLPRGGAEFSVTLPLEKVSV